MSWKNFVSRRVIASRRRGLATATLYGLSLAVRFTSATGEEVEIPQHAVHALRPLVSIVPQGGPGLPYQDWGAMEVQPFALRDRWPSGSSLSRCSAP